MWLILGCATVLLLLYVGACAVAALVSSDADGRDEAADSFGVHPRDMRIVNGEWEPRKGANRID
jgi:hypothetical protein